MFNVSLCGTQLPPSIQAGEPDKLSPAGYTNVPGFFLLHDSWVNRAAERTKYLKITLSDYEYEVQA